MMASGWTRKRGSTWTWYIEDVPDPSTGRPRQVSKGGFRTRKEARDALLEAQAALRSGTFVEPSKRTVGSFLLQEWLPGTCRRSALDAGSMCLPHGCSSCWAWFRRTADAERLDA